MSHLVLVEVTWVLQAVYEFERIRLQRRSTCYLSKAYQPGLANFATLKNRHGRMRKRERD